MGMDMLNSVSAMIALASLLALTLAIAIFSNDNMRKSAFSIFIGVIFLLSGIALLVYGLYLAFFVGW
jgi:uncharacterized membrane protein HdeD (DUF308 family)